MTSKALDYIGETVNLAIQTCMAGFKNDLRVFLPKTTTNLVHQEWVTNKTFHSRLPKMFL